MKDLCGVFVLAAMVVGLLVLGGLTSVLGDEIWRVFGRVSRGSLATMWLSHITALTIVLTLMVSIINRLIVGRWWWDDDGD